MKSQQYKNFNLSLATVLVIMTGFLLLSFYNDKYDSDLITQDRIPFDSLKNNEYGRIKNELFKNLPVPDHGLFGLHVVREMQGNDFFDSMGETFYNYHFNHISVSEMLLLMKYLDSKDLLPTKSLIVSLPSPHIQSDHYFNNRNEIPKEAHLFSLREGDGSNVLKKLLRHSQVYFSYLISTFEERFDWKVMLSSFKKFNISIGNLTQNTSHASPDKLKETSNQKKVKMYLLSENGAVIGQSRSFDGLRRKTYYQESSPYNSVDIEKVKTTLNQMIKFAESKSRKIYFLVPPAYYDRDPYHINEVIVNQVIKDIPTSILFDNRSNKFSLKYFTDDIHPNNEYWDQLILL